MTCQVMCEGIMTSHFHNYSDSYTVGLWWGAQCFVPLVFTQLPMATRRFVEAV